MADGGTLSLSFTINDVYSNVYYSDFLGIPYPVWVFFSLAGLAFVLMKKTIFNWV